MFILYIRLRVINKPSFVPLTRRWSSI